MKDANFLVTIHKKNLARFGYKPNMKVDGH
jgi:hypothetical protein